MTPELQGFAYVFRTTHGMLHRALEGLTDEQAREPGDGTNAVIWVAAHMVTERARFAQVLGAAIEAPWEKRYVRGYAPASIAEWPTIAEVRAKWDEIHAAFTAALESKSSADALAKSRAPGLADDLLGVVALAALHDSYHIGQIGSARRHFGLPGIVG